MHAKQPSPTIVRPEGRVIRRGTRELAELRAAALVCAIVGSDDDTRGVPHETEFAWNLLDQDPQAHLVALDGGAYRIERTDHDLYYLLRPAPEPAEAPSPAEPRPQIIRRNTKRFAEVRQLDLACVVISRDNDFREVPRDPESAWKLLDEDRRAQLLDLGNGTFKVERRPRPMWFLLRPVEAAEEAA
jgi:hypothetical protein